MKKYFLLLFFVLLISSVSSQEDLFRVDEPIDLKYFCQQDNGADCDITAICAITVLSPTAEDIVSGQNMTNQGEFHNYTLNQTQVTTLGTHTVKVNCADSILLGQETFTYLVTPSGTNPSTGQSLIYLSVLALSVVFLVASIFGAIKLPWSNERNSEGQVVGVNDLKWLKLLLWMMTYLFLIWVSWLSWKAGEFFTFFDIGVGVFKMIFWVLMSFLVPIFSVMIIAGWLAFFHDKEIKELIQRGISPK